VLAILAHQQRAFDKQKAAAAEARSSRSPRRRSGPTKRSRWDTQAFAMQSVPLRSFPPGRDELDVIVKVRLTRATAAGTVAFSVGSEVR
jgi:hypothetical protein